jgi:hypothetical protein
LSEARAHCVDARHTPPLADLLAAPSMRAISRELESALCGDAPILVLVESGTGKTVLAQAIAEASGRRLARPGVAMRQAEGIRAGAARVVGARVNPRVPVHLTAEGRSVAVRFAHPHAAGAIVRLEANSLAPVSPEEPAETEHPTAPATGPVRIALRHGRFVVCWRRGDIESGYRLMAQAWTAGGSPLGDPVVISPPEADVLGAPELVAVDGEHAVAAFAAISGERFDLLAVSLEVL